jgi:chromosome segregation ATPase
VRNAIVNGESGYGKSVADGSSRELIKARHEIERLRAQLAAATKAAPPATAALLRVKIENDELRRLLAASRKAEPEQIANLRRDIERLQAEHTRRNAASRVTEAARERFTNDPRIAQLRKANSELRKEIAAMREHFDKQSQKQGMMSFKTVSIISKALHPDSKPSDHDRAEAFKAFSGWKADRNAAER